MENSLHDVQHVSGMFGVYREIHADTSGSFVTFNARVVYDDDIEFYKVNCTKHRHIASFMQAYKMYVL